MFLGLRATNAVCQCMKLIIIIIGVSRGWGLIKKSLPWGTKQGNNAKPLCHKLTSLLSCQVLHCSEISCNHQVILWVLFCLPQ